MTALSEEHNPLTPGCYEVPLGGDLLWWLSKNIGQSRLNCSMVILPTRRTVDRLKRLLYKNCPERVSQIKVIAYDDLSCATTEQLATQQLLWNLSDDASFVQQIYQTDTPSFEQRQQFVSSLNSVLNEWYSYELTVAQTHAILTEGSEVLAEIIKRYESLLKEHNQVHPVAALVQGFKNFSTAMLNLPPESVCFVIDGPIPPALVSVVVKACQHHYVLINGLLPSGKSPAGYSPESCYIPLHKAFINADIKPQVLPVYVNRKPLIDQIQRPVFQRGADISKLFNDVHTIEASNELELAKHIIDLVQEVFRQQHKVVTIVTPNRQLSKILRVYCQQSNINVDDSFGIPLSDTAIGSLLLQVMKWNDNKKNYKELLKIMSHPLSRPYWGGLAAKLDFWGRYKQRSFQEAIHTYIPENSAEQEALAGLTALINTRDFGCFQEALTHGIDLLQRWGVDLNDLDGFEEISQTLAKVDSLDALKFLFQTASLRTQTPKGQHVRIMGVLEVRLMNPTVLIIANLNEGEWPLPPSSTSWLPSAVRNNLGLPGVDQVTGVSSKVLLSLLTSRKVFLCRTTHTKGQPTQASRWWRRLKLLAGVHSVDLACSQLSDASRPRNRSYPLKIPNDLLPQSLSISELSLLMNNPGQFILERILKLNPLPPWEAEVDQRHKGIIVHDILKQAVTQGLSLEQMMELSQQQLNELNLSAHRHIFWDDEITQCLKNFQKLQTTLKTKRTWVEVKGSWTIETQFGQVTVVGRADRIDQLEDGSWQIIDYKTGSLPTKQSVYQGLAPQLTVLGLMLTKGAFKDIPPGSPFLVSYWGLSDGTSVYFLFEELLHLEQTIIRALEQLLDPSSVFEIDATATHLG